MRYAHICGWRSTTNKHLQQQKKMEQQQINIRNRFRNSNARSALYPRPRTSTEQPKATSVSFVGPYMWRDIYIWASPIYAYRSIGYRISHYTYGDTIGLIELAQLATRYIQPQAIYIVRTYIPIRGNKLLPRIKVQDRCEAPVIIYIDEVANFVASSEVYIAAQLLQVIYIRGNNLLPRLVIYIHLTRLQILLPRQRNSIKGLRPFIYVGIIVLRTITGSLAALAL